MKSYVAVVGRDSYLFRAREGKVVWASQAVLWAVGRQIDDVRSYFKINGNAFYEVALSNGSH